MRQLKAHIRATETHCYRCGQRIDWSVPYRDDLGNTNGTAGTVEHKLPLVSHPHLAEDPANLGASHLTCNLSAGDSAAKPGLGLRSREW